LGKYDENVDDEWCVSVSLWWKGSCGFGSCVFLWGFGWQAFEEEDSTEEGSEEEG
jgi:hypothetical protein